MGLSPRSLRGAVLIVLLGSGGPAPAGEGRAVPAPAGACERCGWSPPKTEATITVRPADDLMTVLRSRARPDTTVLLEDGTYRLGGSLDIPYAGLVLRGKRGDRSSVAIVGDGMASNSVPVAISVSAPRVTLADLTIGLVRNHGVQVRGERRASGVTLHNLRILDTGEQLIKGSLARDGVGADDGLVACCLLEYSDHAPSDYTNGIDVLGGKGWVVRDNRLLRIRGPEGTGRKAGPAILFWGNSRDTVVERNLVVDCHRGIALGLRAAVSTASRDRETRFDHQGGIIRNNVVCNINPWADEGIEVGACPNVRVEYNSVLVAGASPWSISLRYPTTTGLVRNNLANKPAVLRDGARAKLEANVVDARLDWFVDPIKGDLRLSRGDLPAIDAGTPIPDVRLDFLRKPRTFGKAPDAGAFESRVNGR